MQSLFLFPKKYIAAKDNCHKFYIVYSPKHDKVGCTGIIVSEELGFNVSLKENTDNFVNVKSLKPGTYHYSCGMGMYKGTVTVN